MLRDENALEVSCAVGVKNREVSAALREGYERRLILREVNELTPASQAALIAALQNERTRANIIVSVTRTLDAAVAQWTAERKF